MDVRSFLVLFMFSTISRHERCGLTDHKVSRQQRFDYMTFDLPGDEHPLCGMRTIILECLDRAIQQVDGEFSPEFRQKLIEFDRVENYRELLTWWTL